MRNSLNVRRRPDGPGSWRYDVVASTVEAVQEIVSDIEKHPLVIGSLFRPISCTGNECRTRGYVVSSLSIVE